MSRGWTEEGRPRFDLSAALAWNGSSVTESSWGMRNLGDLPLLGGYWMPWLGPKQEGAPSSWTYPFWVELPSHWAGLWLRHQNLSLSSLRFSKFLWITNCIFICCTGASLIAQSVKNLPAMQETWVQFLGREDPLEKEMATPSSILAWRIPQTEEPGGLQSMGSQESQTRLND